MLAPAQVQRLTVKPPLGMHGVCKFLQRLLAVLARVVDHHVLRPLDDTCLEILQSVHALVDVLHDKAHVVDGACRQSEYRLVLAAGVVQHQKS